MIEDRWSSERPPQIDVSVVVCCYNSSQRLPPTLAHLARQRVTDGLRWEVVVVDNASTDATFEVAERSWREHGVGTPFRVVAQGIPGLSAARAKGLEVAAGALVVFCDDDNWLDERYVQRAHEVMRDRPDVAVLGGRGEPVFETAPPPEWFVRYAVYYALGPQGDASGDVSDAKGYVYGAGLVLRASAWRELVERGFESQLTGRKGDALSSSEDRELCYALRLLGYRVAYDDGLVFRHEIAARRVRWSYFLTMVEMAHRTAPYMEAYQAALDGASPLSPGTARRRWLSRSLGLVGKLVRKPTILLGSVRRREGASSEVQWRRVRGSWHGWTRLRRRYLELQRAVDALRGPRSPDSIS